MQVVIEIDEEIYKLIKRLPSNSQEATVENVMEKAILNGIPIEECEDAISRELAIKIIKDNLNNVYEFIEQYETDIRIAIEELPSVQPKRGDKDANNNRIDG